MGSKKFKGKICAYCGEISETGDHVVAREFFLPQHRANLPKVPACKVCNFTKSELEAYLTAVLPFGGQHATSSANLTQMVPKRLAANARLRRQLQTKLEHVWISDASGLLVRTMALPLDGAKFEALFGWMARGLCAFHWGTCVAKTSETAVFALTTAGESMFDTILSWDSRARVQETLGDGTVSYEGVQGVDNDQISVWRFSMYGALDLRSGNSRDGKASRVGVMIGPREIGERAKQRDRWLRGLGAS